MKSEKSLSSPADFLYIFVRFYNPFQRPFTERMRSIFNRRFQNHPCFPQFYVVRLKRAFKAVCPLESENFLKMSNFFQKGLDKLSKMNYTKTHTQLILKNMKGDSPLMNAMLEAYRNSCNQLTIRISELSQQIQQTCSQTEADCLNSRKHLLQTERLELLRDMQDMQPYVRGNVHEP